LVVRFGVEALILFVVREFVPVVVDEFDSGLYSFVKDVITAFRGRCPRGFEEYASSE
jgi:hypothetical protein